MLCCSPMLSLLSIAKSPMMGLCPSRPNQLSRFGKLCCADEYFDASLSLVSLDFQSLLNSPFSNPLSRSLPVLRAFQAHQLKLPLPHQPGLFHRSGRSQMDTHMVSPALN